jgi:hypothetical protein
VTVAAIPLILKVEAWPASDRDLWERAFAPSGIFDDGGVFEGWSAGTRGFHTQQYGTWLSFIFRHRADLVEVAPCSRITKDTVSAYIAEAMDRVGLRTIANFLLSLATVARGFSPGRDWEWLLRVAWKIYRRSEPTKLKTPIPITAHDIYHWALGRLAELEAEPHADPLINAMQVRQALTVGLLIARPVRARAFVAMTVDRHIERKEDEVVLAFSAEDMKDHKARRFPAPDGLVPSLIRYVAHHRPILLRGCSSDALWISERGAPLSQDSFTSGLALLTRRVFGETLRPHAFRHIAATSIATVAPAHVGIIKDILGHASLRMAEQHYNRATAVEASSRMQSVWHHARSEHRSQLKRERKGRQ